MAGCWPACACLYQPGGAGQAARTRRALGALGLSDGLPLRARPAQGRWARKAGVGSDEIGALYPNLIGKKVISTMSS